MQRSGPLISKRGHTFTYQTQFQEIIPRILGCDDLDGELIALTRENVIAYEPASLCNRTLSFLLEPAPSQAHLALLPLRTIQPYRLAEDRKSTRLNSSHLGIS